jgi:hypothetical protein
MVLSRDYEGAPMLERERPRLQCASNFWLKQQEVLMSTNDVSLLRWTARILSLMSTAVLLLFLFGEKFEPSKITATEWLGLTFFPFGIVLGFAIAWWKEGLGGGITVGSLLGFYLIYGWVVRDVNLGWWFVVFAFPGFIFLACYALSRLHKPAAAHP